VKHLWHLLFIPHERNNHRANLLQPAFIGIFIALYLLNQSLIKTLSIARPGILGYSSEITAQKVYEMTNIQRTNNNLSPLHYNASLSKSAAAKAQDMFANNYWAHYSPQGRSPWDFFKDQSYQYSIAGENLAKDFYDTDSMIKAWMNSPTHKANIVNPKYKEIGIGVVNGVLNGVKTTLVVQHFASPVNPGTIKTDTPEEITYRSHSNVLSQTDGYTAPLISPLQISQAVGAAMFILIIGVLVVDAVITLRNKTQRFSGSSFGHIGFLAIILLLLLFTRQGAIF
jgi:hypothetical protein